MDKNQIIGFTLISTILIGYMFWQESYGPKPEIVQQEQVSNKVISIDSLPVSAVEKTDSNKTIEAKTITIETELLKLSFSNVGADITSAVLVQHKDLYEKELELIDKSNFSFNVGIGKFNTKDIAFDISVDKEKISGDETATLVFKSPEITITYSIKGNSYLLDYNIQSTKGKEVKSYTMNWVSDMKRVELGIDESFNNSTINYYTSNEAFDYLSTGKGTEEEEVKEPIKWFSIKQRFFNIGFIAEKQITESKFKTIGKEQDTAYFKLATADLLINTGGGIINDNYSMYIGPNDYRITKGITNGYDENVDMGWGVFGWINKFMVIPIFKFLEQHMSNYGLIILALVIIIKILLFPIAYRSYVSMAKMKVLKPELDEIKARVGDDMQKQQQEQMKLYQQVGVNPVSGCIPTILQMPFLFAMFRFFPNSIELRHESFLWAHDLSTYDAPLTWSTYIWPIGNHISAFCVLMTITSVVYAWYTNQMNPGAAGPMKNIGYIMPVMFFFILNSFSAGLTFYYFVSTLITILQQQAANMFIDKDKIRAQLEENKKNAGTRKKSGFRARIEEAMKMAQEQQSKKK